MNQILHFRDYSITTAPMSKKTGSDIDENIETFLLYWLDADVKTSDHNKIAEKQLRSINKQLKTFDDPDQCQQIIQSLNEQDRLILIVSGRIGRELIPRIHHIRQLSSIYLYCQDKAFHEEWARDFFKVREVIVDLNQLTIEIKLAQYNRMKIDLSISYNIYTMTDDQEISTPVLNKNFLHSFLLIKTLLRLEPCNEEEKEEFLLLCKKEYKGEKNQLQMIEEFHAIYKPEKALWWFTRNSFLHRMLEKVLRSTTQYFEQLLLSRSLINDIHEQIKQNQCQSAIRTYFGQWLWPQEMEYLRHYQSRYLAIHTFWLTNINREKIVHLLKNSEKDDEKCQVLFIIDADPNIVTNKAFADVSKCCHFDEEGEILFTLGSIFRIIQVKEEGEICLVRIELCDDHEEALQPFYQSIRVIEGNETKQKRINLQTFGDLLHRMEQYDLAERIYRQLLAKLPSNDPTSSDLYFALAGVIKCKKEYDSSLKFYEKALKNKTRTNPTDYIIIGKLHACIGEIHRLTENDKEALKCFEKAIQIYRVNHDENHSHMADFFHNAASICRRLKKNTEALEYCEKALTVDNKQSTSNSFGIAKTHHNMGMIYFALKEYDHALTHYQLSLAIKLNILPALHLSIAKSYANIASVYQTIHDLRQALDYYQKAATIYHRLLPVQDADVIQIDNEIHLISQRLK